MVLVRLRTDEGVDGLGEACRCRCAAAPAAASARREVARRRRTARSSAIGADAGGSSRRGLAVAAAPRRRRRPLSRSRCSTWPAKAAGLPLWRLLGRGAAEPVACNATLVGGPARPRSPRRRSAGRSAASHLQAEGRRAGRRRPGRGRARRRGPEARIRVDANGAWRRRRRSLRLDRDGAPRDRARRAARGGPRGPALVVRSQTAIPIAADESVTSADDARRAVELGACELATVKLAKVGGIGAGARDRRRAARLPLERARRAGRDRGRGPAGQVLRAAAPWRGPRPRPGHPAPVRGHDRPSSASCAATCSTCPRAPASASRSTKRRWSETGSNAHT